jgi:TonB family protein
MGGAAPHVGGGLLPFLLASLLLHLVLLALPCGDQADHVPGGRVMFVQLSDAVRQQPPGAREPVTPLLRAGRSSGRLQPIAAAAKPLPEPGPVSTPAHPLPAGGSEAVMARDASRPVAVAGTEGAAGRQSPSSFRGEGAGLGSGRDKALSGQQAGEPLLGSSGAPSFLRRVVPVYPVPARRFGREGEVLLRLAIDEQGRLRRLEVLAGAGYGFTAAAVAAVQQSTFLPARKDDRPVSATAVLRVAFSLADR